MPQKQRERCFKVESLLNTPNFASGQFPKSFNVWDSLGKAYYRTGNLAEALKNYEKSLQLNPGSEDGKRMLGKIRRELKKQ